MDPEEKRDRRHAEECRDAEHGVVGAAVFAEGAEEEAAAGSTADPGHGMAEVVGGHHAGPLPVRGRLEKQKHDGQFVGRPRRAGDDLHADEVGDVRRHEPEERQWSDREPPHPEQAEGADPASQPPQGREHQSPRKEADGHDEHV